VNQIENHISFIESGIVRLFIPKDNPEKEKWKVFILKKRKIY
jgi:hypothetical protein